MSPSRYLFTVRLYSALERSIAEGKWRPEGVPAICELLAGCDRRGVACDVVLLGRAPERLQLADGVVTFAELPNLRFHVLPFGRDARSILGRALLTVRQALYVWRLLRQGRHGLVYSDRVHVFWAGLLARLGHRVVLRLLGVAGLCDEPAFRRWIIPNLQYWGFGAPFSQIVCSIDGSPVERFLALRARKGVPITHLYNGVAAPNNKDAASELRERLGVGQGTKLILSLGRLEISKGLDLLLEGMNTLSDSRSDFMSVVVGDGRLRSDLESQNAELVDKGLVRFLGALPHAEALEYLTVADIVVSLNSFGNLSNVVLEAMNAGKCVVAYDHDPTAGRDARFREEGFREALALLPPDATADDLAALLNSLLEQEEAIAAKGSKARALAGRLLTDWRERIDVELEILRSVAAAGSVVITTQSREAQPSGSQD